MSNALTSFFYWDLIYWFTVTSQLYLKILKIKLMTYDFDFDLFCLFTILNL